MDEHNPCAGPHAACEAYSIRVDAARKSLIERKVMSGQPEAASP